jgi:hypothetical protein
MSTTRPDNVDTGEDEGSAMAQWVRVDCDLLDHPKFQVLAEDLGDDEGAAALALLQTWLWFAEVEPSGRAEGRALRAFTRLLGKRTGRDGSAVVAALVETGFLDAGPNDDEWSFLEVHDWAQYNGLLWERRLLKRQQKRIERERATGDNEGDNRATRRRQTERDSTTTGRHEGDSRAGAQTLNGERLTKKELKPFKASDIDNDFEFWWVEYGKVGSKADARKLYGWWRERGATRDDLFVAARGYRSHCEATDCKMKHARTFLAKDLNRWKEWAEGEEHGTMDVSGTRRLSDVIEAGIDIFGGDHERIGPATHPQGGQAPRLSLPTGGVETGE